MPTGNGALRNAFHKQDRPGDAVCIVSPGHGQVEAYPGDTPPGGALLLSMETDITDIQ